MSRMRDCAAHSLAPHSYAYVSSVCLSGVNDSFNVLMAVRMRKVPYLPSILFETSWSDFGWS